MSGTDPAPSEASPPADGVAPTMPPSSPAPLSASRWPALARLLPAVLGVGLLAGALLILERELRRSALSEVRTYLGSLPLATTLAALALTAASYLLLTAYDALAFRYLGRVLPYRKVAFASFLASAFSNMLGHSMLSGGSVRYRLYRG